MIICISGLAGSGKTTLANSIVEYCEDKRIQYLHVNSDKVAKKIFIKKYGVVESIDIDYSSEELDTIYESMYHVIENTLKYNPKVVVITDGMYRKSSQRILLEVVANKVSVPFILVKVDASAEVSKRRVMKRLKEEGLGGWVDANNYEEIYFKDKYLIKNNSTIREFKTKVDKFLNKLQIHSVL